MIFGVGFYPPSLSLPPILLGTPSENFRFSGFFSTQRGGAVQDRQFIIFRVKFFFARFARHVPFPFEFGLFSTFFHFFFVFATTRFFRRRDNVPRLLAFWLSGVPMSEHSILLLRFFFVAGPSRAVFDVQFGSILWFLRCFVATS